MRRKKTTNEKTVHHDRWEDINRIPDTEYRVYQGIRYITAQLLENYHTRDEVKQFNKWFTGQTGMIVPVETPLGTTDVLAIYVSDYERWLREGMKSEQNPENWD